MTQQLQNILDAAWENRANISVQSAPKEVSEAVEHVISELNNGTLRVATRDGVGQWTTHQWIKKAVLLSFRLKDNALIQAGDLGFYDKVPTKFAGMTEAEILAALAVANETRCEIPLPSSELSQIVRSVCRYEPESDIAADTSMGSEAAEALLSAVNKPVRE